MNAKNSIIPKWGINRYQLRGCKSFEFTDPAMRISHPISKPFAPSEWRGIAKNFRIIGKIHGKNYWLPNSSFLGRNRKSTVGSTYDRFAAEHITPLR